MNKTGLKGSKAACLEVWELLRPHLDSVAGNAVRVANTYRLSHAWVNGHAQMKPHRLQ